MPSDSATGRSLHGDAAAWTLTDHLLANIFDGLAIISWQLGGDKRVPKPKPLPRPGVSDRTIRHGRAVRPRAEVVAYLRRFAPSREEVTVSG